MPAAAMYASSITFIRCRALPPPAQTGREVLAEEECGFMATPSTRP
jgi:hypothetical protein